MINPRNIAKDKLSNILRLFVVRVLSPMGVTPNQLTIAGFLITCIGAIFVIRESLFIAGCILLFGAGLDMLDGIMARATGSASARGALLDSVMDRISEAVIFLCILTHYLMADEYSTDLVKAKILATFIALISSVLVSYLRAKGESLGVNASIGWITRPERILLIVLGLMITLWYEHSLFISILVIATGSMVVSAQRFRAIWHATRGS